ncbi:MAG: alpha/beta hydrolase family protein [Candidatus Binatia bacterium]
MTYDPFRRGPFPVGVRTAAAVRGDRALPTEIWYPATDAYAGQDVAEATRDAYELIPGFPPGWQEAVRDAVPRDGSYPLVAFSHGFGGHRRQTTFLCTHLASHGYVVGAVDHTGNSILDVVQAVMMLQMGGAPPDPASLLREFIVHRPADVSFMIDGLLDGSIGEVAVMVDAARIGMSGHSFGGWTTLAVAARDRRIRAALPLAPAGGSSPLPVDPLKEALDFDWGRDVPTLFIVADRDTLLPLAGMHELYEKTQGPKRMVVLRNADHMHFCDQVEQIHEMFRMMPPPGEFERIAKLVPPISELCPGEHAYQLVRALGLAHMDAALKGNESAAAFLAGDVAAFLAERGVSATVV